MTAVRSEIRDDFSGDHFLRQRKIVLLTGRERVLKYKHHGLSERISNMLQESRAYVYLHDVFSR